MRDFKPSFTRGEITPLLHARTDLAVYNLAVGKLLNFIVLPQGGITRRPGFSHIGLVSGDVAESNARLIPFVYSREDSVVILLSHGRLKVYLPSTREVVEDRTAPYSDDQLKDIRWVQSGNTLFIVHPNYPPLALVRKALDNWQFESLLLENGPWAEAESDSRDLIRVVSYYLESGTYELNYSTGLMDSSWVWRLIKINFLVEGSSISGSFASGGFTQFSETLEVGAEWRLTTTGNWTGFIRVEKSPDDSAVHWMRVYYYRRKNPSTEGNLSISGSVTDGTALFRLAGRADDGSEEIQYTFSTNGYEKSNTFRITSVDAANNTARARWIKGPDEPAKSPVMDTFSLDWNFAEWSAERGYPSAIALYQNRLVMASSPSRPQTVWFSKIDDYQNFSVSDPLRDDDAITVTLSADDGDGIHDLVSLVDLIVFTGSGEWRIKGSGEGGAITPSAIVAHQQTKVGSASIIPLVVGGQPVYVQSHRRSVHSMQYSLEIDSYAGSELSIMSNHLFGWKTEKDAPPIDKRIKRCAYQNVPDSIMWFALEDGTAATCTYNPEHDVIAWARQEFWTRPGGEGRDPLVFKFEEFCVVPFNGRDELWAIVRGFSDTLRVYVQESRDEERVYTDYNNINYHGEYPSVVETLRVNSDLFAKKLLPRVSVMALRARRRG
jgi:hypothetical protein